jgi:hypothetical protein
MLIKFTFLLIVLDILQITAEFVDVDDNDAIDKFDDTSFVDFNPSLSKSSKCWVIIYYATTSN